MLAKAQQYATIHEIMKTNFIREDPFFSEANMDLLMKSKRELEDGKIIKKSWEELERLANG